MRGLPRMIHIMAFEIRYGLEGNLSLAAPKVAKLLVWPCTHSPNQARSSPS